MTSVVRYYSLVSFACVPFSCLQLKITPTKLTLCASHCSWEQDFTVLFVFHFKVGTAYGMTATIHVHSCLLLLLFRVNFRCSLQPYYQTISD